jgi:cytochrome c biogenesis protein CcdA
MVGLDATFYGAFVAGMLSFLSPCILPLVPPYLCFLGGVSLKQLEDGAAVDRAASIRVVLSSVVFVLGFATVFIAFGATASVIGQIVVENIDTLALIAGILIIVLGLHFLGGSGLACCIARRGSTSSRSRWASWAPMSSGWPSRSAGHPASGRCWRRS